MGYLGSFQALHPKGLDSPVSFKDLRGCDKTGRALQALLGELPEAVGGATLRCLEVPGITLRGFPSTCEAAKAHTGSGLILLRLNAQGLSEVLVRQSGDLAIRNVADVAD